MLLVGSHAGMDFPVRIVERTNEPEDIGTSDWSLHWHEDLEFQYVKAGAVQLSCQEGVQWIRPQEIFFANWCEPHHAVGFESHSRYYVIQVDFGGILEHPAGPIPGRLCPPRPELPCLYHE